VVLFRNFNGTQLHNPNIEIIYILLILLQHEIGHKNQWNQLQWLPISKIANAEFVTPN
jgi:hypothetical protein